MKSANLVVLAATLVLVACSRTVYSDSEGNTVKQNADGTMTVETDEGTATIQGDGSKMTIKTDDGESVEVEGNTEGGTIKSSDGGTVTYGKGLSESELGVKFYPGSKETAGGGTYTMEGATVSTSVRETSDEPDAVATFYTKELGKPSVETTQADATTLIWQKGNSTVTVVAGRDSGKTIVSITVANKG